MTKKLTDYGAPIYPRGAFLTPGQLSYVCRLAGIRAPRLGYDEAQFLYNGTLYVLSRALRGERLGWWLREAAHVVR